MDVYKLHKRKTGKLEVVPTVTVKTKESLSLVYTPHVGKICMAIKDNPSLVREYTIAGKTVAVVSDGSAVLGFGNIGAKAALPVMEGKCVIFKEFGGLDAFPICLEENDCEKLIAIIKALSVNFAAINLEDISAPRCFEIESRLSEELDIPVVHDDQHGTAIVTLAALLGALKLTGKKGIRVVISGAGAAGTAVCKILLLAKEKLNLKEVLIYDSVGLISLDRSDLNSYKLELAKLTHQTRTNKLLDGLLNSDVFIGLSAPNLLSQSAVKTMKKNPIIFAMANPVPEIMPEDAYKGGALIVATGRSDLPNQVNNALAYPGVFKGLLRIKANKMRDIYKIKAAEAIFKYHLPKLSVDNILPSILDKKVPEIISHSF